MNSSSLPASFVLVLPHPVPVSLSIINAIEEMTGKIRVLVNLCKTATQNRQNKDLNVKW